MHNEREQIHYVINPGSASVPGGFIGYAIEKVIEIERKECRQALEMLRRIAELLGEHRHHH